MEILEKLRAEDPPPLTEVDPTIPSEVAQIIERALKKDPAQRWQDLAQMRGALEAARRRIVEDAERVHVHVRAQLAEVHELQVALARHLGESLEDETRPIVDERARLAGLKSVEADVAAQITRLKARVQKAQGLEPVLARGAELLARGEPAAAIAEFERVLSEVPEHRRALDGLRQARTAAEADRERREEIARVLRDAQDALEHAHYARCVELLEALPALAPPADQAGLADELREAAEAGLAREAAAEQAEHSLDLMHQARAEAEAVGAPRHAAELWTAAEGAAAEGQAAFSHEGYAEAWTRFDAAAEAYRRAEQAAR
jgi:hypothetical protein